MGPCVPPMPIRSEAVGAQHAQGWHVRALCGIWAMLSSARHSHSPPRVERGHRTCLARMRGPPLCTGVSGWGCHHPAWRHQPPPWHPQCHTGRLAAGVGDRVASSALGPSAAQGTGQHQLGGGDGEGWVRDTGTRGAVWEDAGHWGAAGFGDRTCCWQLSLASPPHAVAEGTGRWAAQSQLAPMGARALPAKHPACFPSPAVP